MLTLRVCFKKLPKMMLQHTRPYMSQIHSELDLCAYSMCSIARTRLAVVFVAMTGKPHL